ncbi:MAG: DsbA family oxidoreductase [Pseudomonadota bacterium]
MDLEIFSDTICPWCFIGKRRLERALQSRPQIQLRIRWRAYQLNPEMPASGMDRLRYLAEKFGGEANANAVYGQIKKAGKDEGIAFNFDRIKTTPNTINSHRLVNFAQRYDRQDAVVQGLFDAFFLQGLNIGELQVLIDTAASAGLDPAEVEVFLASDDLSDQVRAEDSYARRIGIRGVPCFIFNGNHALSGAHPPEVLYQFFDIAVAEQNDF